VERGLELEALSVARPTLEDVYLQLTGTAEGEDGAEEAAPAGGRRRRGRR
jgi:hypothetical protein